MPYKGNRRPEDDGIGVAGIRQSLLIAAAESRESSENTSAEDGVECSTAARGTKRHVRASLAFLHLLPILRSERERKRERERGGELCNVVVQVMGRRERPHSNESRSPSARIFSLSLSLSLLSLF